MTTPTDVVVPDDASAAEYPAISLTLLDRCDRCGAQAFVRASVMVGDIDKMVDLLFCGHHFAKNEDKLRETALHIQDEREKINEAPSPSANAV